MSPSDDLLAELPAPLDEEPADLRESIHDELADHLACAIQQELRSTDDTDLARHRAIVRFGNPAATARRLWLDAMKGRLMNQRLAFLASLAMLVAVLALCATTVFFARENRAIQREMLARLEALSAQTAPADPIAAAALANSYDWPVLEVTVVDVAGTPLAGVETTLRGRLFGAEGTVSSVSATTNADGIAQLGPTTPGYFELSATLANAFRFVKGVTVRPGPGNRVTLTQPRWDPDPQETRIRIAALEQEEDAQALAVLALQPWVPRSSTSGPSISGPAAHLVVRRDGMVARIPWKAFRRIADHNERPRRGVGETPALLLVEPDEEPLQWLPSVPLDHALDYAVDSTLSILVPAESGAPSDVAAGFRVKSREPGHELQLRREQSDASADGQGASRGTTLVIQGR